MNLTWFGDGPGSWHLRLPQWLQAGKCRHYSKPEKLPRLQWKWSATILIFWDESRWTSSGAVILSLGQTLLYSGPPNENVNHQNGVEILLNKKTKLIVEWNPVSERIVVVNFMSKTQKSNSHSMLRSYQLIRGRKQRRVLQPALRHLD